MESERGKAWGLRRSGRRQRGAASGVGVGGVCARASGGATPRTGLIALAAAMAALGALVGPAKAFGQEAARGPAPASVSGGLPDGRAYEEVSPVEKNGNEAGSIESNGQFHFAFAATDGEGLLYYRRGAFGEAQSNLNFLGLARRSPSGWRSEDGLPAPLPPFNISLDTVSKVLPAADLSALAFENGVGTWTAEDPAPAIGAGYLFDYADRGLTWLGRPSIAEPYPAKEQGEEAELKFEGGSPNLETIYFSYDGTLLPEDAPRLAQVEKNVRSAPGFYEYSHGSLRSAGILPASSPLYPNAEDPYGAQGAAYAGRVERYPADFNSQVSTAQAPDGAPAGSRAFFVSPVPLSNGAPSIVCRRAAEAAKESVSQCLPQLYVREGGTKTVLLSRDAASGQPAPEGISPMRVIVAGIEPAESWVFAAPDGARAFFQSKSKLAVSATGQEPTGSGPWTYEFDLEDERLSYLPGVTGAIIASSSDGSRFMFVAPVEGSRERTLDLWEGKVIEIARLPDGPAKEGAPLKGAIEPSASPARANAEGSVFVFESDAPIPGFGEADSGGYEQVFRYTAPTATQPNGLLSCISCVVEGAPSGNALISHDNTEHAEVGTVTESAGVSANGGRVFFDTPESLVPQDTNGVRDVYEWEAPGEGSCPSSQVTGCRYLISSGTSEQESSLLASSESGDDVFFATTSALSPLDTEGDYGIYDARAPHLPGEEVAFPLPSAPVGCQEDCQTPLAQAPAPALATSTIGPSGNLAPVKVVRAKKPSKSIRARRLRHALAACKHRLKGRPQKLRACKRRAERRYAKSARSQRRRLGRLRRRPSRPRETRRRSR